MPLIAFDFFKSPRIFHFYLFRILFSPGILHRRGTIGSRLPFRAVGSFANVHFGPEADIAVRQSPLQCANRLK
jgi:hypothetical protein